MRMSHFSAAFVLGLLTAIPAWAQELAQPTSFELSSYSYHEYTDQEAAAPVEAASPAPEGKPCRWCQCGELADPWTLPQPRLFADRNIKIGGWLSGGIFGNQWGDPSNGPLGFRDVGDAFTADQLWLYAERQTDTKGCGWDVGGRVDYLFGADGPDTQAFGDRTWDYGWNSAPYYGSAIPQAYVEIAYNNLKVKGGRFYTLIGNEVVPAPQNFFYSHSYSCYYAEPFTHTGVLSEYTLNDRVKIYNGWVNGWDEGWEGKNNGSQYLGGLSLKLTEKATLAWMLTAGRIGTGSAFAGAANGDVYMNSIVFNWAINDKWTYIFQHDLGTNYNNGVSDNQWYTINQYFLRKISNCLSVGGRVEWFQDPQGARVVAGNTGNYYEVTGGLNWKPHSNITVRPELRYDSFDGTIGPNGRPFHSGASNNQLSFGTDFIFTY